MIIQPTTRDAYQLLHRGALALNRIQANGMRVDVPYLLHQKRVLERKQAQALGRFMETELAKLWKRRYGADMSVSSDPQLSRLLFKDMGLTSTKQTKKGNNSVTRGALEDLDVPGLDLLIEWRKLEKTLGTYVLGLLKEQTDGVLRPFFHLGRVITYRSSSSAFNFQNLPVRDPEQGKAVRTAILPWPGQRIIELDYGGLEVRIAACYHQDPTMLKYLNGAGDMHRDSASDLFSLPPDQVTKDIRFHAKNGWVFAQFYGSWYKQCAENIWAVIDRFGLTTKDGVPLKDHMRKGGIKNYNDFESHCHDVEEELWNKRFPVYRDWRRDWVKQYEKRGYFETKTGFTCRGTMARNDAINYPVQGSAFHCLLWSLCEINDRALEEEWLTKIMGQIHDSDVNSVQPEETEHVLDTAFRISEKDIRDHWDWIIVPLEVEAEAGEVDGSWYGKTKVEKSPYSQQCINGHKWHRKTKAGMECLTCNEILVPF